MMIKAISGIIKGKIIMIEDKGGKCTTFIGSNISEDRFKLLMANQVQKIKIGGIRWEG